MAQDKGTLDDKPLPPLANPADPSLPAKQVFGRALTPIEAKARSIGFYWRGCLAGAKALPVDGEAWQVMRLSRNRMWGNPAMIAFLERFSRKARADGVWNGILVGDISQPRGGPMLTGHASHQVGLDADVWLTPMPDHTMSREEREEMSAVNMVTEDGLSVDRSHWTEAQARIIKAAAEEPEVDRIFVNAAIKKALCETHKGEPWMTRVHAYWGHNYHFHIRIKCPAGDAVLRGAGPGAGGRSLRQVARLVVHRRGAASQAGQARLRRSRWRSCRPSAGRWSWRNSLKPLQRRRRRSGATGGRGGRRAPAGPPRRRRSGGCRRASQRSRSLVWATFMKPSSSLIAEMATIEAISFSFSSPKSISAIQCGRPSSPRMTTGATKFV